MASSPENACSIIPLIRAYTRECSFDFDLVALRIREQCQQHDNLGLRLFAEVTAEECRDFFATDYSSDPVNILQIPDQPTTFDDVLRIQKQNEERSRLSYARVFQKVRDSLGISTAEETLNEQDEVILAMEKIAVEKHEKELAVLQQEAERRERLNLQSERERLKARFNEGRFRYCYISY